MEKTITLPCNVGDFVYWLWCNDKGEIDDDEVNADTISYFYIDGDGLGIAVDAYDGHLGHYVADGEPVDGIRRIYLLCGG